MSIKTITGRSIDSIKTVMGRSTGSVNTFLGSNVNPIEYTNYIARVSADGGTIQNNDNTRSVIRNLKFIYGDLTTHKLLLFGEGGHKIRTSGVYKYETKWYDASANNNDAVQATEAIQPLENGYLPSNEKLCIQSSYNSARRMTFTPQTFTNTEAWTFSWFGNWSGGSVAGSTTSALNNNSLIGKGSDTLSNIKFHSVGINRFSIINEAGTTVNGATGGTNSLIGKYSAVDFVAPGNGTLLIYVNGVWFETLTVATGFVFGQFLSGFATTGKGTSGMHVIYALKSGASTATQISNQYTVFRSQYVAVENVLINGDYFTSSNCNLINTPMGNIINNISINTNLEKVTGGNFEAGLIGAKTDQNGSVSTWTLNTTNPISGSQDGRLVITTAVDGRPLLNFAVGGLYANIYYRFSFKYKVNSGTAILKWVYDGASLITFNLSLTGTGTFTTYLKALSNSPCIIYFGNSLCDIQLDDVSIQQVGWADLQNLYDDFYAKTAGTIAQKTKAACLAAAAWRSPSDDPLLDVIYGKRYNQFAITLLALDIAAWDIANPTNLYEWDIPTRAELETLSEIGGNAAKIVGSAYWTSANGTNAWGLTVLPAGYVATDGANTGVNTVARLGCKDALFCREIKDADNTFDEVAITTEGVSLRLKKKINELFPLFFSFQLA
jgi:hypothetical protein